MTNETQWEVKWKVLSRRLDSWNATAETFLKAQNIGNLHQISLGTLLNRALSEEGASILNELIGLELPEILDRDLAIIKQRLLSLIGATGEGSYQVLTRWATLAALRVPLDNAVRESEEPQRRLVDRAFLHLNRMLSIDPDIRKQWQKAFNGDEQTKGHETKCEQLGALHLLSHGIYAFKADASSGRTDLLLGGELRIDPDIQSADAMLLTEWKLVRDRDNPEDLARVGRHQAQRYSRVELAGFELRKHCYIVLVSLAPLPKLTSELIDGVTYHYINISIDKISPSREAKELT